MDCSGWPSSSATYSCPGSLSTTRARWVAPGTHAGAREARGVRGRPGPFSAELAPRPPPQGRLMEAVHLVGEACPARGLDPRPVPAVRLPVVLHGSRALERGSHAVSSRDTAAVSKAPRGRGQRRERPRRESPGRGSGNNPGRCVLTGCGGVGPPQALSVCAPHPPAPAHFPSCPCPAPVWPPCGCTPSLSASFSYAFGNQSCRPWPAAGLSSPPPLPLEPSVRTPGPGRQGPRVRALSPRRVGRRPRPRPPCPRLTPCGPGAGPASPPHGHLSAAQASVTQPQKDK